MVLDMLPQVEIMMPQDELIAPTAATMNRTVEPMEVAMVGVKDAPVGTLTVDPVKLLMQETGVTFGAAPNIEPVPVAGSANGFQFTGISGSLPINDKSGKLIAMLHFSSQTRELGQLSGAITLPDGTPFAKFERQARAVSDARFAKRGVETENPCAVLVNGATYATITAKTLNGGELLRPDGGGLQYNTPFCQPMCKWLAFGGGCFLCTFGVSGCIMMYFCQKSERLIEFSSLDGATKFPPLMLPQANLLNSGLSVNAHFGPDVDAKGKVDLLLMAAMHVMDEYVWFGGHADPNEPVPT